MRQLTVEQIFEQLSCYTEIDPKNLREHAQEMLEILHECTELKTAFHIFDVKWSEAMVELQKTAFVTSSSDVIRALADCPQAAIALSTLGPKVDQKSVEINSKDALSGMIFDLASSQLLEIITQELHEKIDSLAKSEGLSTTFALIPGLGDFGYHHNAGLLNVINGEKYGVICDQNISLSPSKSTISLIGLCRSSLREDPFMQEEIEPPEFHPSCIESLGDKDS